MILSVVLFMQISFAQQQNTDTFTLLKTYTGTIADVAMDNFDNLYIISSTGQIKKLNAAGELLDPLFAKNVDVFLNEYLWLAEKIVEEKIAA